MGGRRGDDDGVGRVGDDDVADPLVGEQVELIDHELFERRGIHLHQHASTGREWGAIIAPHSKELG